MDIFKEIMKELSEKDASGIYLREIALLMEEIDKLRVELEIERKARNKYEIELKRIKQ